MGHTEMLLAVAGLEQNEVTERCRRLAEGDWSSFPPAEQAAFAFARRQAEAAWDIGDTDVAALIEAFGPERALDVIYHLVGDAVFDGHMRDLFGAAQRLVAIYSSNSKRI